MPRWNLDDLSWAQFEPAQVDPDLLRVVKAAALVEYNGGHYARYLRSVFREDESFCALTYGWAEEEVQHGLALGRWAELADPDFSLAEAAAAFTVAFQIPTDLSRSVRGSCSGELVARCIVETATSSFYSALRDAATEPVLKDLCARIAADEYRHYKLFYRHMQPYLRSEGMGQLARLRLALARMREGDDDELAMAYYYGNGAKGAYDRRANSQAYGFRAYRLYRPGHCQRAVKMILKACGLNPQGWLASCGSWLLWRMLRRYVTSGQAKAA